MDLADKRAVVVGGSKGLGLDTVAALARHGCRVVSLARSEGGLATLRTQYPELVDQIETDIANPDSVRQAFAAIQKKMGGVDYLILNAALAVPSKLAKLNDADIRVQLDVNMAGPIYCLREAATSMQNGTIVFISSESINYPFPMLHLYGAVKAGMETFLRGVRSELYHTGKNRVITFRAGSMGGTAFSDAWSESIRNEFFLAAAEAGHIGKSGTPMPTDAVAEAIVQVLTTPPSANIEVIEYRSVDAH